MVAEKFLDLEQTKREQIIRAAMKEFATQGYDRASTNNIVKEAGISKGSLFHYFGNKKNLYLFIYEYAIQTVLDNLWRKIDLEQKDVLARWRQVALLKIELIAQFPELFNFLVMATLSDINENAQTIQSTNEQKLQAFMQDFFADLDYSLFRPGIEVSRALEVISWTIEGFSKKLSGQIGDVPVTEIDFDRIMQELDQYMQLLRDCFYQA
jgi:TetR/AcrR family transcriptional regulator